MTLNTTISTYCVLLSYDTVFSDKWFRKFRRKKLSASSGYVLEEVGKVVAYVEEVRLAKDMGGQSETRKGQRSWGSGLDPHGTVGSEKGKQMQCPFTFLWSPIPETQYAIPYMLTVPNCPWYGAVGGKPAQNCVRSHWQHHSGADRWLGSDFEGSVHQSANAWRFSSSRR